MDEASDIPGRAFHTSWAELPPRKAASARALLERMAGREVDAEALRRAAEAWLAQGGERGWMGLETANRLILALFRFEVLADPRARLLQASDMIGAEVAGLSVTVRETIRAVRELACAKRCSLIRLCHDDQTVERLALELGLLPQGSAWALAAPVVDPVVVPFPARRH
jgi:hypothetical protein